MLSRLNILTSIILAICVMGAPVRAKGQGPITFGFNSMGQESPIQVTQISIDNAPIPLNTPVPVRGGWLAALEVDVKNISNKIVIAGDAILSFPETGDGSANAPVLTSVSNIGRYPQSAFRRKDGSTGTVPDSIARKDFAQIKPGEVMRFKFAVNAIAIEKALNASNTPVHTGKIMFASFYFSDGSKWSNGLFLLPEPAPVLWRIVTPSEFAAFQPREAQ